VPSLLPNLQAAVSFDVLVSQFCSRNATLFLFWRKLIYRLKGEQVQRRLLRCLRLPTYLGILVRGIADTTILLNLARL
jgi:hypothetical protein